MIVARKQQPSVAAVCALPIIDSVRRHWPARILVNPDLLSRRRVEGHDRAVFRQNVNDAANLDGIENIPSAVSGRVSPRDTQLADVRAVDLLERGVLRSIRRAAIFMPRCVGARGKSRKTA